MGNKVTDKQRRQKAVEELVSVCQALQSDLCCIEASALNGDWDALYGAGDWPLAKQCEEIQELAARIVEAEIDAVLLSFDVEPSDIGDYDGVNRMCFEIMRLRKEVANVET